MKTRARAGEPTGHTTSCKDTRPCVSDHPGPAPRTRLSGRQVAKLLLNLHRGQCVLEGLIKATDLRPVPQSCRMGCAGGTGRGRRAGADGTGTQRFGGPLGTHPALRLGTRGPWAPLAGQAEGAVLADQGHPSAARSCPWAAWKDGFSGSKWQSRNARPNLLLPHRQAEGSGRFWRGGTSKP